MQAPLWVQDDRGDWRAQPLVVRNDNRNPHHALAHLAPQNGTMPGAPDESELDAPMAEAVAAMASESGVTPQRPPVQFVLKGKAKLIDLTRAFKKLRRIALAEGVPSPTRKQQLLCAQKSSVVAQIAKLGGDSAWATEDAALKAAQCAALVAAAEQFLASRPSGTPVPALLLFNAAPSDWGWIRFVVTLKTAEPFVACLRFVPASRMSASRAHSHVDLLDHGPPPPGGSAVEPISAPAVATALAPADSPLPGATLAWKKGAKSLVWGNDPPAPQRCPHNGCRARLTDAGALRKHFRKEHQCVKLWPPATTMLDYGIRRCDTLGCPRMYMLEAKTSWDAHQRNCRFKLNERYETLRLVALLHAKAEAAMLELYALQPSLRGEAAALMDEAAVAAVTATAAAAEGQRTEKRMRLHESIGRVDFAKDKRKSATVAIERREVNGTTKKREASGKIFKAGLTRSQYRSRTRKRKKAEAEAVSADGAGAAAADAAAADATANGMKVSKKRPRTQSSTRWSDAREREIYCQTRSGAATSDVGVAAVANAAAADAAAADATANGMKVSKKRPRTRSSTRWSDAREREIYCQTRSNVIK